MARKYIPVYAERGRMLFRFDPRRAIIEIKQRGIVYRVNLYTVTRDGSSEHAVEMASARPDADSAAPLPDQPSD